MRCIMMETRKEREQVLYEREILRMELDEVRRMAAFYDAINRPKDAAYYHAKAHNIADLIGDDEADATLRDDERFPKLPAFQDAIKRFGKEDVKMLINWHRLAARKSPDNRDIRLKFLKNEIDEDNFKRLLFLRDRKAATRKILAEFNTQLREMIIDIYNNSTTLPSPATHIANLLTLTDHCNDQLAYIAQMNGTKPHRISP